MAQFNAENKLWVANRNNFTLRDSNWELKWTLNKNTHRRIKIRMIKTPPHSGLWLKHIMIIQLHTLYKLSNWLKMRSRFSWEKLETIFILLYTHILAASKFWGNYQESKQSISYLVPLNLSVEGPFRRIYGRFSIRSY